MQPDPRRTPRRTPGRTPRGYTLLHRPGRPAPYVVRWRQDGARLARSFSTEAQRAAFISELAAARSTTSGVRVLDPGSAARLDEFRRLTGGADLLEVGRFWLEHHRPLTLRAAVERYSAAQEGRTLAGDTLSHRRLHLSRIVAALGEAAPVDQITAGRLRGWLDSLVLDGRPASPASRRHHRANASRLWAWLRAEGLVRGDPFAAVPVPDGEDEEINLLTVDEGRHLLFCNRDNPSVARLAIEAFAGLRFTSSARLQLGDIAREDHGITMPAKSHKTGRRHYIDGLPGNVWAWVDRAPAECWSTSARMYAVHKSEMFRSAGYVGERFRNVLRHSFASYHCAAYKNPGLTASILTHRGQDMLWAHYRGRATERDGMAWFGILPP